MKTNNPITIALTTLSLLFSAPLFAADNPFQSGVTSFKAGNYAAACKEFKRAYETGNRKETLLYNLGVCNYKLGRYQRSKKWFTRLLNSASLSQIAHYNLGLIALKEGDIRDATRWFRLAQQGSNSTIITLAKRQLEGGTKSTKSSGSDGFTMVNLTYGYDDNIIDPADATTTDAGDNYLSIFVVASHSLSANRKSGWSVKGSIYRNDYLAVDAYDMLNIKGGITRFFDNPAWPSKLSLDYGLTTLNSADYLSKTTITFNSDIASGSVALRYRFNLINAADVAYDHLAGSQQQFKIERRWRGTNRLRLSYEYEQNSRNDIYSGTILTTSYSPTHHTISLKGHSKLTREWIGKSRLSYRSSQYPVDSNPEPRHDSTSTVGLSAERKVWSLWHFSAGITHTDNSSNISTNSYSRNDLAFQLTRTF